MKSVRHFPCGNDKISFTFQLEDINIYINREIEQSLLSVFRSPNPQGVILAGIVGCGKTTAVEYCLTQLGNDYSILRYSGDDIRFRQEVANDSRFIDSQVKATSQSRTLVFVDEVQKSEAIFDALKYAFDHSGISFIVSGSNPAYLNTVARKRLQRRARLVTMSGFSMPEILAHAFGVDAASCAADFRHLLLESDHPAVRPRGLTLTPPLKDVCDRYLSIGGLPLAHLSTGTDAWEVIRSVVDRGFEAVRMDNADFGDLVEVELANIHSREFTYTNIFKKTGERRRDKVNHVISNLLDHGYLVEKRPLFPNDARRSYLCVYSYTDPGIVSYLTGDTNIASSVGPRIEGTIHSRLALLLSSVPLKTELGYYKPYQIDPSGSTRFEPGEVDFVVHVGTRFIPIEVKATADPGQIDLTQINRFIKQHRAPFGVVLYGGVPFSDTRRQIVYWPWWLV